MNEINKALEPANHYDACFQCSKRTDGLMTCTYPDGETIQLCPDCIKDSGFCLGCGYYSAGIESFDFSDMNGYCAECVIEFEEQDDDLNNFDYYSGDYDLD